jgi:HSP20 family protein
LADWFAPFSNFEPNGRTISLQFSAPVSLWEDDGHLWLEVDLPGVAVEDLEITVHDDKLYLRGERKGPENERKYLFDQVRRGKFEHVLGLPEAVDGESVEAELSGGVLRVGLAKRPETQPKKIAVKAS